LPVIALPGGIPVDGRFDHARHVSVRSQIGLSLVVAVFVFLSLGGIGWLRSTLTGVRWVIGMWLAVAVFVFLWVGDIGWLQSMFTSSPAKVSTAPRRVGPLADNYAPEWLPDGRRIAFTAEQRGHVYVYVANTVGKSHLHLARGRENIRRAWSPDGKRFAFGAGHGIHVVTADYSGRRRLTAGPDWYPVWSPDGKRIAFERGGGTCRRIYLVRADGGGLRNLTPLAKGWCEAQPVWSPDGKWIAFTSDRAAEQGGIEIYVMRADGSSQRRVTFNQQDDVDPDWSADSKWIAFTRSGALIDYAWVGPRIYKVKRTGTEEVSLTYGEPAFSADPDFSPDGTQIAYTSTRRGGYQIYVMDADGSNRHPLMRVGYPPKCPPRHGPRAPTTPATC
jgi:TolB protein